MRCDNKKIIIREKYNKTAEIYDSRYMNIQFKKYKLVKEIILTELQAIDNPTIIDVGCGTGLFLKFFHSYINNEYNYVCGDLADAMIRIPFARKYHKKSFFILFNGEHLPFKDNISDITVSFTVLQNVEYPDKLLSELVRITKDNRILIISCLKKIFNRESIMRYLKKCNQIAFNKISIINDNSIEDEIVIFKISKKESFYIE